MNTLPVSVILLTFNEETNIRDCLESVKDLTDEIYIVDSFSTDKTLDIAKEFTNKIIQHPFETYGQQRNWAQENLPIKTEWIFHLDSDERLTPELIHEIRGRFENGVNGSDGFLVKKRVFFLNRWIKHGGHYPVYHLRLFLKEKGRCENRRYDQHFICDGKVEKLRGDLIEENEIDLTNWINRHNRWSSAEAQEFIAKGGEGGQVRERFFGNPIERRRWLKNRVFNHFPLFFRSLGYFIYRYFFRFGFLDGTEGLIFHFLQGFWFRFLVDSKIYEFKKGLGLTPIKSK